MTVVFCLALVGLGCGSDPGSSTQMRGALLRAKLAEAATQSARESAGRIKSYGRAATEAEATAIAAAMRAFYSALAAKDYAKACTELNSDTRRTMRRVLNHLRGTKGETCEQLLPTTPASHMTIETHQIANAGITSIRVGPDDAYVLYKPAGGGPLSYLTMARQGNAWKATSLGAGTEVEPQQPNLPEPVG
ncbi:MAG TPA: hypothetical protein VF176_03150 [Solirubrobacterales bacterium]